MTFEAIVVLMRRNGKGLGLVIYRQSETVGICYGVAREAAGKRETLWWVVCGTNNGG